MISLTTGSNVIVIQHSCTRQRIERTERSEGEAEGRHKKGDGGGKGVLNGDIRESIARLS